jgi:nucleoside-diphosphate-sugar epimerase
MKVLVTGATGLIGNAILQRLLKQGHQVRALVRDPARAARVVPPEVELVRGDVTEPDSLPLAMRDVEWLFHAAGLPEQWQADESIFDRVNHLGTVNVLRAALAARVKRVVYTSTMDVFAAPSGGTLVESQLDTARKATAYERSKQDAERAAEQLRQEGLELVYVNPSAVYGPGPAQGGVNAFFIRLLNREMPALPPRGMSVAYVDRVADAHLAAAEHGVPGERYLVSDTYVSNADLVREIFRAAGEQRRVPPTMPAGLMKLVARVSAPLARTFGFKPLLAPGELAFLLWDVRVDTRKAQHDLHYTPMPLAEGVSRTISALREQGLVGAGS